MSKKYRRFFKDGDPRYLLKGEGGENNTASNLGNGTGIFAQKEGVDLQFKSLIPGSNISISPTSETITISATGGGGEDGCYCIELVPQSCACDAIDQTTANFYGQFDGISRVYANDITIEEAPNLVIAAEVTDQVYDTDFEILNPSTTTETGAFNPCEPQGLFRTTATGVATSSRGAIRSRAFDTLTGEFTYGGSKQDYVLNRYNNSLWGCVYYPYYENIDDWAGNEFFEIGHGSFYAGTVQPFYYQWGISYDPRSGRIIVKSQNTGDPSRDWTWDSQIAGPNGGGVGNDARLRAYDANDVAEWSTIWVKQRLKRYSLEVEIWKSGEQIYTIGITRADDGTVISSNNLDQFALSGPDIDPGTTLQAQWGRGTDSGPSNGRHVMPWMFFGSADINVGDVSAAIWQAVQLNLTSCLPKQSVTPSPDQVLKYEDTVDGKDQYTPEFIYPTPPLPEAIENTQLMPGLDGAQDSVRWGQRDSRTFFNGQSNPPDMLNGDMWYYKE